MKLTDAVRLYVQLLQAQGCAGTSTASVLRTFANLVGRGRELESILPQEVLAFLNGYRPLTRYWHRKYSAPLGFFRFALARGMLSSIPLPADKPRCRQTFQPYIYTDSDIARLVQATDSLHTSRIEPRSLRMFLLLLFGAGLRPSEALNLFLKDVDLQQNVLTVRETKFYKTRFVPVGPDLTRILRGYVEAHHTPCVADPAMSLLIGRDGGPLTGSGVRRAFARLRLVAGVQRNDALPHQPRLHDLRATFAVRRLISWYREGADVQRMLPLLSTYLGHASIAATQVYLPLTPDLLAEASNRFERYATTQEDDHERLEPAFALGQALPRGVSGDRQRPGEKHAAQLP